MTHPSAILKAREIAQREGSAVIVLVADPAHHDGQGPDAYDAVTVAQWVADQRGGGYLTKVEEVCK